MTALLSHRLGVPSALLSRSEGVWRFEAEAWPDAELKGQAPWRDAVAALRARDLPAELSMSAGTFVCNHVFYGLMRLAEARRHAFRAGFLHVPALPGQARGGAPGMPLESTVVAIGTVLQAAQAR